MYKLCYFDAMRKAALSSSYLHGHHYCKHTLLWFSYAAKTLNPSPEPHFMAEYLINSCGLSPERAIKATKHLPVTRPPSDPDSVLRFLKRRAFTDADIAMLTSKDPRFLYSSVDKTLEPKLLALREMGFSEPEIVDLVSHSPSYLWHSDLRVKIRFWKSLLGTNEQLLKACRRDNFLLTASLAEKVMPNVSLLRDHGVPDCQIAHMVVKSPRLVTRPPEVLESSVKWAEELGFYGGSGMFCNVLQFVSCNTREGFDAKLKFLYSLDLSESEVMSALKKQPKVFTLTEENLRHKVDFFIKEVGFAVAAIVSRPVLLSLSLERRLRPRHFVMRVLKGDEFPIIKTNDFCLSDKSFLEKYVAPHTEKVPGLYEAYVAACAGKQGTDIKKAEKFSLDWQRSGGKCSGHKGS